ncbi:MAG: hypothetical protein AABW83_01265 [Nanoarchaeota archaeon]
MKYLVFDSGPLINFSMNGILDSLEKLKDNFDGEFLITKEVKEEIIDTPLKIKQFELGAIRLEEIYKKGIIKLADLTKEDVDELRKLRENYMETANNMFKAKNKEIHLLDKGECAALALSTIMKKKIGRDIPIVIDERTTRMICEKPENLKILMEKKLHTKIKANTNNYNLFKGFKIIRSTELAYIINKKNLFTLKNPKLYEAVIYGLKFKGCSISEKEVELLSKM